MSPVKGCPTCGRPRCTKHRAGAAPRRRYSDTAAYRAMVAEALETYGAVCVLYCHEAIDLGPCAEDPLVLAHVQDHADDGAFTLENVRPAHQSCNLRANAQRTAELRRG